MNWLKENWVGMLLLSLVLLVLFSALYISLLAQRGINQFQAHCVKQCAPYRCVQFIVDNSEVYNICDSNNGYQVIKQGVEK